jgi:hypothetical protein
MFTAATSRIVPLVAIASFAIASASAWADGDVPDVWVSSQGGSLMTSGWDHDSGTVTFPGLRVFEAEMGEDPDFPFSIDEPGIGSDLVGTSLTMNLLQGMSSWTGAGFTGSDAGLLASFGGQDAFSTTGGSFSFTVTAGLDLHPEYTIFGAGGTDPTNGVYLSAFTFSAAGFGTSDTFWIVWNLGASEEDHEAAIAWVESNLVPAPGALAALVGLTAVRSRTRRR